MSGNGVDHRQWLHQTSTVRWIDLGTYVSSRVGSSEVTVIRTTAKMMVVATKAHSSLLSWVPAVPVNLHCLFSSFKKPLLEIFNSDLRLCSRKTLGLRLEDLWYAALYYTLCIIIRYSDGWSSGKSHWCDVFSVTGSVLLKQIAGQHCSGGS